MPPPDEIEEIDERLTVLLAQDGDRDAFAKLLGWYDQRLFYFVRRIVGETDGAFDVLQSVWLSIHRKLRKLRSPDAFRVWIYRIAHDEAVSELRRKSKRPIPFEETTALDPMDEPSAQEAVFDNAELVHIALEDLSLDHRRVLTLRFLEDMSIEEIAEVVGCSSGTVKSRLHYAKLALRRRIEERLND